MCRFLTPPRKSIYYFRRPISKRLRPIIGQREFFESLKTKDREEAKRRVALKTVYTDQLLAEAEKALAIAEPKSPADIANQRRADEQSWAQFEYEEWAAVQQAQDAAEEEARQEALAPHIEALETKLANPTAQLSPTEEAVRELLRAARERGDVYGERWRNLQAELRRARKESRQESGRDSHNAISSPQAPALSISPNASVRTPQGKIEAVSISGLFDMLTAQPGRLVPSIRKEWQASIQKFIAFIGHDDARRVTARNILEWRNHARDEPKADGSPRSAARINAGYLSPLRAVFSLAMDEMLLEENPASGVSTLREVKKPKVRDRQFTKEERQTILTTALSFSNPRLTLHRQLAHRWVPWICAYSGARVNEITQMRAEDVTQVDGHWVFKITPEAGRTKTKEFRYVPIHEHLIEQGILAVVEAQGSGPLFYDPARGRPESERGQYKKTGEALARWVRGLGITDPDIQPNHAWRHTFTSMAMVAGIDERAADYVKGHASQGVSRKNYTHHSMDSLIPEMAKFPRFQIDRTD